LTLDAIEPNQPVVVIGLDVADGALIQYGVTRGLLPNFARLVQRGTWVDLRSSAEVLHTSAWPTFSTGTLPGKHGVYFPYQAKSGHQKAQQIQPSDYGVSSFWAIADQHGKRCLVYDVPESFPESGFKGRAVFEWGTWAWYGAREAQPTTLLEQLNSNFGDYPLGMEAKQLGLGMPTAKKLLQVLPRCVAHKSKSLQWLMQQAPWDLTVSVFCETHLAAHYLWPAHIKSIDDTNAKLFEPVLAIYRTVDEALGELWSKLSSDTTLMIVSGDGVRPNYAGWHLLGSLLERLDYIVPVGTGAPGARSWSAASMVKSAVPPKLRRLIADHLPWKLRNKLGGSFEPQLDWSKTRAFTLPTDLEGCIRVNLKGREPHGIVNPGADYRALCEEIKTKLLTVTNPKTGRPAVEKVWLRDDTFPGDRSDQLPDIVVSWSNDAPISALTIPNLDTIEGQSPDPRTGTHSTAGFLLAVGPRIPQGQKSTGHLCQIAPTVLQRLNVGGRFDFDGDAFGFVSGNGVG
jgi:predicted AlkP superfamily phosphohydrolase/phosphomutase